MVAVDTNVWARAYLDDDREQAAVARSAISAACAAGGVFVPLLVLAELAWVLRMEWDRKQVLDALEHIFAADGVVVESRPVVERALAESRTGPVGFADLLIAEVSFSAGAGEILTFDRAFAKLARVRRVS
jgi:predicted nucleic-acid-binding protein